jgi:prepilin-type N-terminal cleavage/methylation domain-containing protein
MKRVVRHTRARGFTLLEVMMALTILAIGMLGIVALQAATVGSTQDASQFSVANSVARTWVHRLQRDAQRWNHPSAFNASDDIGDTAWLQGVVGSANKWIRPGLSGLEPNASPAFDMNGDDVPLGDAPRMRDSAVYCTHIRLRRLYPDMIRAEVRVFWKKRRLGDGPLFVTHGLSLGLCSTSGTEEVLGADTSNFHWAYTVAGITKARAQ